VPLFYGGGAPVSPPRFLALNYLRSYGLTYSDQIWCVSHVGYSCVFLVGQPRPHPKGAGPLQRLQNYRYPYTSVHTVYPNNLHGGQTRCVESFYTVDYEY